jgi:hypothetical protein
MQTYSIGVHNLELSAPSAVGTCASTKLLVQPLVGLVGAAPLGLAEGLLLVEEDSECDGVRGSRGSENAVEGRETLVSLGDPELVELFARDGSKALLGGVVGLHQNTLRQLEHGLLLGLLLGLFRGLLLGLSLVLVLVIRDGLLLLLLNLGDSGRSDSSRQHVDFNPTLGAEDADLIDDRGVEYKAARTVLVQDRDAVDGRVGHIASVTSYGFGLTGVAAVRPTACAGLGAATVC